MTSPCPTHTWCHTGVTLAVLPQLMGHLGKTVQPTQPWTPLCRAMARAPSMLTAARALSLHYFCSLLLNQRIFFQSFILLSGKSSFCPMCSPKIFLSMNIFSLLSVCQGLVCFPPVFVCVAYSISVPTVVSFRSFPLGSFLSCCPSFLLFSGSPFSTVLLGRWDQALQFHACCLLLALGDACEGSSSHAARVPGELYPPLGG